MTRVISHYILVKCTNTHPLLMPFNITLIQTHCSIMQKQEFIAFLEKIEVTSSFTMGLAVSEPLPRAVGAVSSPSTSPGGFALQH